jgi:hypothetical protein
MTAGLMLLAFVVGLPVVVRLLASLENKLERSQGSSQELRRKHA